MTADEFRGFITNLIINVLVATGLALMHLQFPVWGWILYGIGMLILAPIIPYHPKSEPAKQAELRKEDFK